MCILKLNLVATGTKLVYHNKDLLLLAESIGAEEQCGAEEQYN